MDPRVEKMAHVLVNYCLAVKPGEWVSMNSELPGEPLVVACAEAILKVGGHPTAQLQSDAMNETLLYQGNDDQLAFTSPAARVVFDQADKIINIRAPQNSRSMSGVDPTRIAIRNKAMQPLMETYMHRFIDAYKVVITEFPTYAAAQDAGMSLRQYENFVFDAAQLNHADPMAAWRSMGERQQRLVEWLQDKSEVHISGPGTDLTLNVAGRTWINDDGHLNFPGGEVFTGPHEGATQGTISFNLPGYYQGREVTGVRLRYESGKVVDAGAVGDEEFLLQMLDMDEGARRLGELAFGSNYNVQKVTKNTLFDEKIGGTLHMALGRSIPQTGGQNMSAVHWDMVFNLRDGAEVTVDGALFSQNGEFKV
ncbi:MAG: aminopeptidase [Chloroflexota bacterium]